MDALWKAIEEEAADKLPDSPVVTRAVVIFETLHTHNTKRLNRVTIDAAGKALQPWDASGMMAAALSETLDQLTEDPDG